MYETSRGAKVRDMRGTNCRVFVLWQVCILSAILLLSGRGFAQLSTGSLSGVVRESSGAVVPSANVVLRTLIAAVENTTTPNGSGTYPF
jgi:hypothetical protein